VTAPGETDLAAILQSLTVSRREDPVTLVSLQYPPPPDAEILATVTEGEGTTVVVTVAEAERHGWPVGFVAAWLTVNVHTALDGVGLTAALSTALARDNIACNMLAGYFHDHLLVPANRAEDALAAITALTST